MNQPARYFPMLHGRYDVAPGLMPFGKDFGNGAADQHVFQIDAQWSRYRAEKVASRNENLEKYYPPLHRLPESSFQAIIPFMVQRLVQEHPDNFQLDHSGSESRLTCKLSGEVLNFNSQWQLLSATGTQGTAYRDAFDALAAQVQEDLAVWQQNASGNAEWLAAIHLCYANHWAAGAKIGRPFAPVHEPVANADRILARADQLVDAMINKGPFVRFAWGLATDDRLNHHPETPAGQDARDWRGRSFSAKDPKLFVRIERQTLHPFAAQKAAFFTIRTYFLRVPDDLQNHPGEMAALRQAIAGMSEAACRYKGITQTRDAILAWLDEQIK